METEERCLRCQRPNPEWAERAMPTEWEVSEDEAGTVIGVVCPHCITGEEQQAIDEDMMEPDESMARCPRCGESATRYSVRGSDWRSRLVHRGERKGCLSSMHEVKRN